MDLLAVADFDAVATHGGFGPASRKTGRPKATLSRRVLELENSLGVLLFERGSRPLRLTEVGAALHARTSVLLAELAEAGELARGSADHPRGRLRISAPLMMADMVLGGIVVGFARAYPDVVVDVEAENRYADPAADGYDLVIRVNPAPDELLVGRCIFRDERWLVIAPSIAGSAPASDGGPRRLPAVVRAMPPSGAVWRVKQNGRVLSVVPEPVMRLSSLPMLRDAVLAGAGAALLPRSLIGHDVGSGRLLHLGVEEAPPIEIWALHPSRHLVNPAVTAFIRYLVETFSTSGPPMLLDA